MKSLTGERRGAEEMKQTTKGEGRGGERSTRKTTVRMVQPVRKLRFAVMKAKGGTLSI